MFAIGVATLSVVASGCLQSNTNIELLSTNPNADGGSVASTRALSTRGGNGGKIYGSGGYVQGLSVSQRDVREVPGTP